MGISHYLAMTAEEIAAANMLPEQLAYMACHFSPYGTGLTNIPEALPQNSMLILNDRIPFRGHDMEEIAITLSESLRILRCGSLLLDFQREDTPEELCSVLSRALPCPVGVAAGFGKLLSCPVFLPPCPLDEPLKRYLEPWAGREIWLEAEPDALRITVDAEGSKSCRIDPNDIGEFPFKDSLLHCRYRTEVFPDRAEFTLRRTNEEWEELLAEAETLGVTTAISLYQQMKKLPVR